MIGAPTPRALARSGIKRGTRIVSSRHRAWINTQPCSVPKCGQRPGADTNPIQCAHVRVGGAATAGRGLKPCDSLTLPMCWNHHHASHQQPELAWWRSHGVSDPVELARSFARRSPCPLVRGAVDG